MYTNNLSAKTPNALLDVFMVADEFKVTSCMKCCSRLLNSSTLTSELALLYLRLPPSLRIVDGIKPLVDAALDFLPDILKDITKYQDAALELPLDRIKDLLSSDDLQFDSEDAVYDFVMNWVRIHFQDLNQRRKVLQSELCRFIRFPHMSCDKLMSVLDCSELVEGFASEIVLASLFSKAQKSYLPRVASTTNVYPDLPCPERAYKLQPVKALALDPPHLDCVVYLHLKKEECKPEIYTQDFQIGSERFYLGARRNKQEDNSSYVLGLYLFRQKSRQMRASLEVDFQIDVMSKPTHKYVFMKKTVLTFQEDKLSLGFSNLLDKSWDSFMAKGSRYFVNGVFHVRANIRIVEK